MLFTCAITRAIHLELVEDASEISFLYAFRRYVARRQYPVTVISDNAKIFLAANKTLRDVANGVKVKELFNMYRIDWKFIPSRSPWFGGMYERLIGLTKNLLKKSLGNSLCSRVGRF